MKNIILAGVGRSGTTWLQRLLNGKATTAVNLSRSIPNTFLNSINFWFVSTFGQSRRQMHISCL